MTPLGFNTGYIEELYRQYLQDPNSVGENWKEFFQDFKPDDGFVAPAPAPSKPADSSKPAPASAPATEPVHADEKVIRGPGAKIVENMEASLGVP
ncbi:MAG: 2-oxoglutarate dehydrogenase E1 subunit family protein, partial [Rhodothermales bacterium]